MGRGKRALAAAAILVALAAASIAAAPRAAAEGGEIAGELPVAGGVALVSWSGGPAGALAEAARSRGCNVRSVYANAPGGGFVGYVPGANVAAANRAFLAAYPAGLPASPVLVVCGEPAAEAPPTPAPTAEATPAPAPTPALPLPRIVFLDDESVLSAERRVELREHVASVVRFYAERFGVVAPESTLYVSPDSDAAAAVYRELTGRKVSGFPAGIVAATPEAGILTFIIGGLHRDSYGDSHTFAELMAHEYYHVLQYDIMRSSDNYRYRIVPTSPQWLSEGTATYGEHLYRAAQARKHFLTHGDCQGCLEQGYLDLNLVWKFTLLYGGFGHLHGGPDLFGNILHYGSWAAATAWAVDRSGDPRSHLEYWRALARTGDWSAAFRTAFGMTIDEFRDSFERYRLSLLDDAPRLRVVVVDDVDGDADGTASEGVRVAVGRPAEHLYVEGYTNPLGEIEFPLPSGTYRVEIYMHICHDTSDHYRVSDQDIVVSDQDVDMVFEVLSDATDIVAVTAIDGVSRSRGPEFVTSCGRGRGWRN